MWLRTDARTHGRTKSGKPHVGRPLLGPAKIHQDYGKALMVETIQMMLNKPNNMEKIWFLAKKYIHILNLICSSEYIQLLVVQIRSNNLKKS